jgi:hypothetical protein
MDLLPGIVVGTINRLQLNEGAAGDFYGKGLWQLIAIFGKETKFMVWGL